MPTPTLQSVTYTADTIVLHFDQAMSSGDGTIVVSDGHSQTYIKNGQLLNRIVGATDSRNIVLSESLNAGGDDGQVSYSGNDVTISLSSALKAGLSYSVTMDNGALFDAGGGDYGIRSTTLAQFTVAGGATPSGPSAGVGGAIHFIDNGVSSTDYITTIAEQTVTGTITGVMGVNDFVQVSLDNGAHWHKATTEGNTWSYVGGIETANMGDIGGGAMSGVMLARVSNTSGLSTETASQNYTYGGVAANTAALTGHALTLSASSDSGAFSNDGITKDADKVDVNVLEVRGFHVGDTLRIIDTSNGDAVVGHYVISADDLYYGTGDYISTSKFDGGYRPSLSVDLDAPLSVGVHNLVAVMVDADGIVSAAPTSAATITVDQTASILVSSTPTADNGAVSPETTELVFQFDESIALDNGATIRIEDDNNPNNVIQVELNSDNVSGGTLTVRLPLGALTSGTHYTVSGIDVADLAGNVGIGYEQPLLHFITTGDYNGETPPPQTEKPGTPSPDITDTAPASNPEPFNDGVTKNPVVYIEGLNGSGTWSYRLSPGDQWQQGSGYSFELPEGVYEANQIEIKQTVNGVDSDVATINHSVTVDTTPPTADVDGSAPTFDSDVNRLSGTLSNSSGSTLEIVEVTFDYGASWTEAPTTSIGEGEATWSWSFEGQQLDNYGVRLSDLAGNVTTTVYHLSDSDNTFNRPEDDNLTIIGGDGIDTITVGDNAHVTGNGGGEDGDVIHTGNNADITAGMFGKVVTGDNSTVTVGHYSTIETGDNANIVVGEYANVETGDSANIQIGHDTTVVTGNGNNLVSASYNDNITTGSGNDYIYVSVLNGATVAAGAGDDRLEVNTYAILEMENLKVTGVETLYLAGGTQNDLTIMTAASVRTFSDSGTLTITANASSATHIHLKGSVWTEGADKDGYQHYETTTGEVLLIGQNIIVDTLAGSL